jgi:hypothetical protein
LISGGGMTLEDHWQNEGTIQTIRTIDWDFVVLQEQSKLGMGGMRITNLWRTNEILSRN